MLKHILRVREFLSRNICRTLFCSMWVFVFVVCPTNAAFAACASNEIDVLGDGTQCETAKFSVTTTTTATSLVWTMTAIGTFYVDCGDNGTLSQSGATTGSTISDNTTITRTGTSEITYSCDSFGTGGVAHTIKFGGAATGYGTGAPISFYKASGGTQTNVQSIDGSLGAMFPVVSGAIPRFTRTFQQTKITSIPSGLFSGIDTSSAANVSSMFGYTFHLTPITSIPPDLFSGIDTSSAANVSSMFGYTFASCTSLKSVPTGLFRSINTASATNVSSMFFYTFDGDSQLTSIPDGLFDGIDTSSATNATSLFIRTFYNTKITSIPDGLFDAINTTSATSVGAMFSSTFYNTEITSIPDGLFDAINTTSATSVGGMFYNTFANTQIASIPPDLFAGIHLDSANNTDSLFAQTFYGTKITSIPAGLFSALNNRALDISNSMFYQTFAYTPITYIPAGLFSSVNTSTAQKTSTMFQQTFYGCSNLSGFIPPSTFSSNIKKGSKAYNKMWYKTFADTKLATKCPGGSAAEYNSGFQSDWGYSNGNTTTNGTYRVSCECTGMEYMGTCHAYCENVSTLHVGDMTYAVWADKRGIESSVLHIKFPNENICYVYFEADPDNGHGLKVMYNNTIYRAVDFSE